MCDQQSLRSVCAYAQSDQSLCLSLEYSLTVKLLTKHHLEVLSLKGGCTGLFESTLVKMPHCWKSHVMAQILSSADLEKASYFYFQGDEKKIYEFIVRHFLACCSQDAQGFETTVELSVADELVGLSNNL